MRRHIMRSRHFHASEFEQTELRFMYTDSLLSEKYGTRILCFYDKCEDNHRQSKDDDPDERQHYIDQPLKNAYTFSLKPTFKKSFSMRNIRKALRKRQAERAECSCRHCNIGRQSLLLPRVQKAKNILHSRSQFVAQS